MSNEVLKTMNYHMFKTLVGNRAVENRAENIKESISKIGWISNPIIVNENMEIIDGQSRFQALMELGKPIEYKIIPGLDIVDCRTLNKYNAEWKMVDFLYSHASEGNVNYIRIKNLMETFGINQTRLIFRAASRNWTKEQFCDGYITFTDMDFGLAYKRLLVLDKFKEVLKRFGGRSLTKHPAIFYIADHPEIDVDRMVSILSTCNPSEIYVDSVVHFLESIQKVYNRNLARKNRIHIAEDYRKENM